MSGQVGSKIDTPNLNRVQANVELLKCAEIYTILENKITLFICTLESEIEIYKCLSMLKILWQTFFFFCKTLPVVQQ
jgi:hypothetical protein